MVDANELVKPQTHTKKNKDCASSTVVCRQKEMRGKSIHPGEGSVTTSVFFPQTEQRHRSL